MDQSRHVEHEFFQHLSEFRQMLFLSGPLQVGKTTVAQRVISNFAHSEYYNWDNFAHRTRILQNPAALVNALELDRLGTSTMVCALDELHKRTHWRDFLKGIYDSYPELRLLVTGSAAFGTFSRGGDSLRGRYFPYTLHPLSVAELVYADRVSEELIRPYPVKLPKDQWEALLKFGGFPEPYLRASTSFYNRWRGTWHDQVLRDEVRDLTRVRELSQIESLAIHLQHRVGQLTSFSTLSRQIMCSVDSVRRWINVLESLYYCFAVTPWHINIVRALRKEPKFYLWDWSQVAEPAARMENLVACALLKAVHWWSETGKGQYDLHFIRDKQKREVDFLVVRDGRPWIMVEVKASQNASLSRHLEYFRAQIDVPHTFQLAFDAEFVDRDCFASSRPLIVPALTFLSQLV